MDRKELAVGVPAFLAIALISFWFFRSRGRGPAPRPPALETAAPAAPKKADAPRPPGLIAPRLTNLGALQADIRKYYPEAERRAGREGHVTMAMTVAADGTVSGLRVQTSGGADFDAAALKAVSAMRFSPARKRGRPVPVEINQQIDFLYDGK